MRNKPRRKSKASVLFKKCSFSEKASVSAEQIELLALFGTFWHQTGWSNDIWPTTGTYPLFIGHNSTWTVEILSKQSNSFIWGWLKTYWTYILSILVGGTSINPSYVDVRGTGFWPIPILSILGSPNLKSRIVNPQDSLCINPLQVEQ